VTSSDAYRFWYQALAARTKHIHISKQSPLVHDDQVFCSAAGSRPLTGKEASHGIRKSTDEEADIEARLKMFKRKLRALDSV
jgi:hypothetical protein